MLLMKNSSKKYLIIISLAVVFSLFSYLIYYYTSSRDLVRSPLSQTQPAKSSIDEYLQKTGNKQGTVELARMLSKTTETSQIRAELSNCKNMNQIRWLVLAMALSGNTSNSDVDFVMEVLEDPYLGELPGKASEFCTAEVYRKFVGLRFLGLFKGEYGFNTLIDLMSKRRAQEFISKYESQDYADAFKKGRESFLREIWQHVAMGIAISHRKEGIEFLELIQKRLRSNDPGVEVEFGTPTEQEYLYSAIELALPLSDFIDRTVDGQVECIDGLMNLKEPFLMEYGKIVTERLSGERR